MQVNKNGIPVNTAPKKRQKNGKRKPIEGLDLNMRRFKLMNNECDVEVTIPVFSPIMDLMKSNNWREIYE